MSRKRREAARARAAEAAQAERLVAVLEEAAEAAQQAEQAEQAARNFTMTSSPEDAVYMPKLNRSGDAEVIVWHQPSRKYLPLWTARSLDKASINDMAYPDSAPPGEEAHLRALKVEDPGQGGDCGDCGEEEKRDKAMVIPRIAGRGDKALKIAQAIVHRDEEPDEPEPEDEADEEEEEEAISKVLAAVERLVERLSQLESTRAERLTLDAEIEALETQPQLN